MLRFSAMLSVAALTLTMTACNTGKHSAAGFRLPNDGSPERGKVAFVALECHTCHQVPSSDFPPPTVTPNVPVQLGGQTSRQMTDGYLVSSILNPSHIVVGTPRELVKVADGKSRMPDYADRMTLRQLIDIVAYLQSQYQYYPAVPKAPPGC